MDFNICNDARVQKAIQNACVASNGHFVSATFVIHKDTLIIAFRNMNRISKNHQSYKNAIEVLKKELPDEYADNFDIWSLNKFNSEVPVNILGKTGICNKR